MRYGSVCSGIEAASVAWEPLGWKAQWVSEIEHFPSAVLKHRFPDVPNLGDMTQLHLNQHFNDTTINLLVGGTPCQSFSVAGLRKGLIDPRGNLMLTFLSLAQRKKPRWIVWENVPGVLSSNGGRDFGTFLQALAECGYGFAYRVLDAQYFGVAQRRRRVFVVGYLGDWRPAGAVLFEQDCLSGNTKKSREKRKATSADAQGGSGGNGISSGANPNLMATLCAKDNDKWGCNQWVNEGKAVLEPKPSWRNGEQTAATLTKQNANGAQRMPDKDNLGAVMQPKAIGFLPTQGSKANGIGYAEEQSPTLRAGCDAYGVLTPIAVDTYNQTVNEHTTQTIRSDGNHTDRTGAVVVPYLEGNPFIDTFANKGLNHASTQERNSVKVLSILREKIGTKAFAQWGLGVFNTLQSTQILQSDLHGIDVRPATFSDSRFIYGSLSCKENDSAWLMQSLREAGCERCTSQGWELSEQYIAELRAYLSELPYERPQSKRLLHDLWEADERLGLLRQALSKTQETRKSFVGESEPAQRPYAIRRLTPFETEILQGFPRGWTKIPYRNKQEDQCPDGPRYKACGNSMAVPVMRWIGERIEYVESLMKEIS